MQLRDSLDRLHELCHFVSLGDSNLYNINYSLDFPLPFFCEIIADQFFFPKVVGLTHLCGNKLDCVFSNYPELITNGNCLNPTDLFQLIITSYIQFDIKISCSKDVKPNMSGNIRSRRVKSSSHLFT